MKPPDRELNKAAVKFAEDWAEDEGWPDSSDKAAMAKRFKQALSAAIKSQTGKP
jgi:DNA phosphorothioation-dependent restriction protein DptG